MNIRTTDETKKEFDKKFLQWKLKNNSEGTQEHFLMYLLAAKDGGHIGRKKSKNCR